MATNKIVLKNKNIKIKKNKLIFYKKDLIHQNMIEDKIKKIIEMIININQTKEKMV